MIDARKVKAVCTWLNKPSIASLTKYTDRVFITDVGIGGSEWYSDGARYRAVNGTVILKSGNSGNTPVSSATLSKLISHNVQCHGVGDLIEVATQVIKNTNTATTTTLRLGVGATDTNTLSKEVNIEASAASNNLFRFIFSLKIVDATTIQLISTLWNSNGFGFSGTGTTTANPERLTVSGGDLTSSFFVGAYGLIGGTITTDAITVKDFTVTLKTCG